jgi:NADPH2:quinone reductase
VQGGVKAGFHAGVLMRKRLTITGSTLRARSVEFKGQIAAALRVKVWPMLTGGQIKPVIFQTFAVLEQSTQVGAAAQAHALMESNRHIGKIVLTWGEA